MEEKEVKSQEQSKPTGKNPELPKPKTPEQVRMENKVKLKATLVFPTAIPVNDRILCYPIRGEDLVTQAGIIVPRAGKTFNMTNREQQQMNRWYGYRYFVVGLPYKIHDRMPLSRFKNFNQKEAQNVKIEPFDELIMSDFFEPVAVVIEGVEFVSIHYLDVIAVEKTNLY